MFKIKSAGRIAANVLRATCSGIKPLDADAHYKVTKASISILRQNGDLDAYAYYKENLTYLQSGVGCAQDGESAEAHMSSCEYASYLAEKQTRAARMCFLGGKQDVALRHLGMALHIIQDSCISPVSPARMIFSGDIIENYIKRRYSPLNRIRPKKAPPIIHEKPSDFVKEGFNVQRIAKLGRISSHHVLDPSSLFMALEIAERLSAGLMIRFYEDTVATPSQSANQPQGASDASIAATEEFVKSDEFFSAEAVPTTEEPITPPADGTPQESTSVLDRPDSPSGSMQT